MIEEKKTIEEIAEVRDMTAGTIIGHVAKLSADDDNLDVTHLAPDQKVIDEVAAAAKELGEFGSDDDFGPNGVIRLTPLFNALHAEYGYDELRLALLFIDDKDKQKQF